MENNIKKAHVKFQEDLLYFQHFMLIFVFVIITTLSRRETIQCEVQVAGIGNNTFGRLSTRMADFLVNYKSDNTSAKYCYYF